MKRHEVYKIVIRALNQKKAQTNPPNPNTLKVECEKHCWHEIAPQGAYDPETYRCCVCGRSRIKVLPPIPEGHGEHMPRNYEYEP